MPDQTAFDVLVIGAGAAGLAAARALSESGLSLLILEARARIGGRVLTIRPEAMNRPIELGAEFVQGRVPETLRIAEQAGLALYETSGDDWSADAQGLHGPDDDEASDKTSDEDAFAHFFKAIHTWRGADMPLRDFLDQRFPGARWEALRQRATGYAQGYQAGDVADVSVRWLAADEEASGVFEGGRAFRVLDGYDRVMEHLRAALNPSRVTLLLETPVREVRWSPGQVDLTVEPAGEAARTFTARAAIITLPLGVLDAPPDAAGAVRFVPEIAAKRSQLAGLRMGHTAKVVLRFRDVFWDRLDGDLPQLPRLSFLFADGEYFPTWWTNYPVLDPVLTGWMGGPRVATLASEPDDAIAGHALDSLSAALRVPRDALEARLASWHLHNWSADPFSRGAYSYVRAGGLRSLDLAAQPVAGTLFFAGEATAPVGRSATVHGALASGSRAAAQVVRALSGGR